MFLKIRPPSFYSYNFFVISIGVPPVRANLRESLTTLLIQRRTNNALPTRYSRVSRMA